MKRNVLSLSRLPLQSIRLYLLGKEALEQKEEDSVATGNARRSPRRHRTDSRHRCTRHDYWHPRVCGEEGEPESRLLTALSRVTCRPPSSCRHRLLHNAAAVSVPH